MNITIKVVNTIMYVVYVLRNKIAFKSKNTNTTVYENNNCLSGRYGLTSQFNKSNLVLQRITANQ